MITRRQFLVGLGALTASTLLGLTFGNKKVLPQDTTQGTVEPQPLDCDWVLENVRIADGSGSPFFRGKIAVKGELIAGIVAESDEFIYSPSVQVVDGKGGVVAPGFIDIHTHSEDYVYSGQSSAPFLSQGVTTQVGGNCGRSPNSVGDYFQTIPFLEINYGLLAGYGTLRDAVAGKSYRGRITPAQLTAMQEKLAEEMQAGALGLSVGLEYWPQTYATTEELIALCDVVREYGGFYATHIRSEYDRVVAALEEAIEIGTRVGLPVQYSHIKAGHQENWPQFPRLLALLEEANQRGLDLTADVYPYTYSSTDLGIRPFKHSISEENLIAAMAHPLVFIGSDTGIYQGGRANHPRAYGAFTRWLGWGVRERNIITLEKAIEKMTSMPARRLGMKDRGLIKTGYKADLVVFDPEQIADKATLEKPATFSEGITYVWVNGSLAWTDGQQTESGSGQVIQKA